MKPTIIALVAFYLATICNLSAQNRAFDEFLVDKTFEKAASSTFKSQPTQAATVTVNVNTQDSITQIRQSLFGQNAVGYQGNRKPGSRQEQNWKNGNFSLLRYPGGNWSNKWFWGGNVPSTIKSSTTVSTGDLLSGTTGWMLETDEYPEFIEDMGAGGLVCVNAGYAFYGDSNDPVETAAQYAADWVEFYNIEMQANVKYWEIGNENYGP